MSWLPFAVFGAVAVPLFMVLLFSGGRKQSTLPPMRVGGTLVFPQSQGPAGDPTSPAAPGDLGPLCRQYSAAGYGQVDVMASLAGIGICVGIGVYLETQTAGGLHPLYIGLLLAAGVGLLFYLRHGIRNVRRRVRLYTDGFAYQDGNDIISARWEDIRRLAGMEPITENGRTFCPPGELAVLLRDGRRFTLPFSIKGLEECAAVLYEQWGGR
jgi:hypothetical protein